MSKNYWLIVLFPENFAVTRELGFKTQGLKALQQRRVQRIGPGDRLLYYISHQRLFAATASVTSPCIAASDLPWKKEGRTGWGYKVSIQPDCVLRPDQYMDAGLIVPRMDCMRRWVPEDWYMAFQDHLHMLPKKDFQLVEDEMKRLLRKNGLGNGRYNGAKAQVAAEPVQQETA